MVCVLMGTPPSPSHSSQHRTVSTYPSSDKVQGPNRVLMGCDGTKLVAGFFFCFNLISGPSVVDQLFVPVLTPGRVVFSVSKRGVWSNFQTNESSTKLVRPPPPPSVVMAQQ